MKFWRSGRPPGTTVAEGLGRVLVTGAAGFIGRAVVAELSRNGTQVTAIVRRPWSFAGHIKVCQVDDIGPETRWDEALVGCGAVVHLAARVHVMREDTHNPLAAYRHVNTEGTLALARQAATAGVRRMIFVSSIKVNGKATAPGAVFTEADPPAPVDPYGVSKAAAETGLLALGSEKAMEVVIVRPPLVYGPGVRGNFLNMMRWVASGIPLPLGAVNGNRRSLVGLDNLVGLLLACLHHPAAANQVFLAADGEDISTTALLRRTAAALGVPARLVPVPLAVLEVGAAAVGNRALAERLFGNLQVDIGKAKRILGWRPAVSVDEGLLRAARGLRARGT